MFGGRPRDKKEFGSAGCGAGASDVVLGCWSVVSVVSWLDGVRFNDGAGFLWDDGCGDVALRLLPGLGVFLAMAILSSGRVSTGWLLLSPLHCLRKSV